MRYLALATDYDETLAEDGEVMSDVWAALGRVRQSGRKLILVTGRDLDDLLSICPLDRFDRVVAENGGVIYHPESSERKELAPALPTEFIEGMRRRRVAHLTVSSTLVATVRPYETVALELIRELGLELQVIFNKGSVMIVHSGVTKATGLTAALAELSLSPHNVVGVGDAENDHAFLSICECSVAVANALPTLQQHADVVTSGSRGQGVMELIGELLDDDLRRRSARLARHDITLGKSVEPEAGEQLRFPPYGTVALFAGSPASGKSTATTALLERLAGAGYQFCVLDPEGDYEGFEEAVVIGNAEHAPSPEEVVGLLRQPKQNVIVNLLHVSLADRPLFCANLLPRLQLLRTETGRPHWPVFDEAHHLFPADWDSAGITLPQYLETGLLITVHPREVSPAVLKNVNLALAVGDAPSEALQQLASTRDLKLPMHDSSSLAQGQALMWRPTQPDIPPARVVLEQARTMRQRHIRKYAEGLLAPERSFYFRGKEGKLKLRAHNLIIFIELAEGVDDETWLHHLRQHDYSRWFKEMIGDHELAAETETVESQAGLSPGESKKRVTAAIERRYTKSENPLLPRSNSDK
jgi:HAD superfamily hydrolase (TIGR01484 family)